MRLDGGQYQPISPDISACHSHEFVDPGMITHKSMYPVCTPLKGIVTGVNLRYLTNKNASYQKA